LPAVGDDAHTGQVAAGLLERVAQGLSGVLDHRHPHDPLVTREQVVGERGEQDPEQGEGAERDQQRAVALPLVLPPRASPHRSSIGGGIGDRLTG
jgi:hypothetical protein